NDRPVTNGSSRSPVAPRDRLGHLAPRFAGLAGRLHRARRACRSQHINRIPELLDQHRPRSVVSRFQSRAATSPPPFDVAASPDAVLPPERGVSLSEIRSLEVRRVMFIRVISTDSYRL